MKGLWLRRAINLNQKIVLELKQFKSVVSSNQRAIEYNGRGLFQINCSTNHRKPYHVRFLSSQIKPKAQSDQDEILLANQPKFNANLADKESPIKVKKVENIIELEAKDEDKKRKEIGFETESVLDNSWKEIRVDVSKLPLYYSKLSKKNLTALVVATTMMGCVMSPLPFDPFIFGLTTLGTTLTSTSANTINQFLEVPYDSQMNRTKDRVLVRGNLTPLHAFSLATFTGITGVGLLYFYVNPLTAFLGASTLFLYTAIYTPMKRLSALNTWVGSVVGAIPPLMGYTAMTGVIEPAGLLLAAILYSWQFPHFHALSWNIRQEYSRAGYRMIAVLNPRVCTSSALSHTVALTFMCSYLAPILELTTWNFAIDSLAFNLYFVYLAIQFKLKADANSSRKLFRYSLVYLPFIILLMLMTKHPIEKKLTNSEQEQVINDSKKMLITSKN